MGVRDRIALSAVGLGYAASTHGAWRRFQQAKDRPFRVQQEKLFRLLEDNARTDFGRAHGFDRIRSVAAYQDAVPIRTYADFEPWLGRIAAGESGVLTREPVRMMERSSGSTRGPKLIPYTSGLLGEFSALTQAWLHDLMVRRPALIGRRSYWSVSPAARSEERTAGGVPIGFADDTEYFGPLSRWALGTLMAVPGHVAKIRDVDAWRFETARLLIEAEDLGFISVWNPSFLTLLFETIRRRVDDLAQVLSRLRATQLIRALDLGGAFAPRLWPKLALVSCWKDAHASRVLPELELELPGVEIQGKGLLATEGAVSFPVIGVEGGAVVSPNGAFIELIDLDAPQSRPKLLHEAEIGGRYAVVLSTAGGLYRYALGDEIEVGARYGDLPVVRFMGKLDKVSDLCGEKLSAQEVARAIDHAKAKTGAEPSFVLLAPTMEGVPRYRLYVEGEPDRCRALAEEVEVQLCEGYHYRYCRDLGQLAPVESVPVSGGPVTFERTLVAHGMKPGDIKPDVFDARPIWHDVFEGVANR